MTKTKMITLFTYFLVPVFGYMLYNSINGTIQEAENIKVSEAKVIRRLKEIRAAEKGFHSVYGRYTSDWDSLINFVKTGRIFNYEIREIITQRPAKDAYKGDSVRIERILKDSVLAIVQLYESAKNSKGDPEFPNFNPDKLSLIPDYETEGKKFKITAGKLEKNGNFVDVVEVIDILPLDKTRKEDHKIRKRTFLRFGSMEEASISGNWED
ncbi:MAG: hypothetical protein EAZ97_06580 [Bacteroidetes bacterium]|nr:MAG: hypothetical protein EAZ97_06580 [Bacteroidota bacterium]